MFKKWLKCKNNSGHYVSVVAKPPIGTNVLIYFNILTTF